MKEPIIAQIVIDNWNNINELSSLQLIKTEAPIESMNPKNFRADILALNTATGKEVIVDITNQLNLIKLSTFKQLEELGFEIISIYANSSAPGVKSDPKYLNIYSLIEDNNLSIEDSYNIIKLTCERLHLTYKQLGDALGYSESAINNATRKEVSSSMSKAIELYTENIRLKKELENSNKIKNTLKEWLK